MHDFSEKQLHAAIATYMQVLDEACLNDQSIKGAFVGQCSVHTPDKSREDHQDFKTVL